MRYDKISMVFPRYVNDKIREMTGVTLSKALKAIIYHALLLPEEIFTELVENAEISELKWLEQNLKGLKENEENRLLGKYYTLKARYANQTSETM